MSSNYTKANGMTAQEMDGVLAKHFENTNQRHSHSIKTV
jgi:hypothetical protein